MKYGSVDLNHKIGISSYIVALFALLIVRRAK